MVQHAFVQEHITLLDQQPFVQIVTIVVQLVQVVEGQQIVSIAQPLGLNLAYNVFALIVDKWMMDQTKLVKVIYYIYTDCHYSCLTC